MNPTVTDPVGREDLEKARRDFRRMLRRKRISSSWIEEHAEELLAQARVEYAARLAEGKSAHSVVGWLVNGAWWRAQDLLESQGRRPPISSLETAFHVADHSEPGPEQRALDDDRAATLRRAMAELPEKERRLLALVYFDGDSIRAAGRKIGWRKSAADEHHGKALERLRARLGDDRSLLSPATLGAAAWVALESEGSAILSAAARLLSLAHRALAELAEVGSGAMHRLAEQWRRISPFADPAGAAASSGGGRALGACGVAAATLLCGVAASGVLPPANSGARHAAPKAQTAGERKHTPPFPSSMTATPSPAGEPVRTSSTAAAHETSTPELRAAKRARAHPGEGQAPGRERNQPTAVAQEFGAEAGAVPRNEAQSSGEQSVSPGVLSRPSASGPPSTESPAPSPQAPPAHLSPSGGSHSSPQPASSPEFGL